MKLPLSPLLAALTLALTACQSNAQITQDLTLKVSDEIGQPVANAEAQINFARVTGRQENKGRTNEQGEFRAKADRVVSTNVLVAKANYYRIRMIHADKYGVRPGKFSMPLVLPRVIQPIPLHALDVSLDLPAQEQWLSYDLQGGDWLPPHGKGQVADIRFKFRNEFLGWRYSDVEMIESRRINKDQTEDQLRFFYGKWRGVLEVSFPGEKEGVVTETERYWPYGELRLPHAAPEEGYQPTLRYEANTYEPRPEPRRVGYFLRTRVKLDANSGIVSANYAKIYDDIRFDARGSVSFRYYFNPTPNDRNLEFDPSRNLFPRSMPGTNVAEP